MIELGKKIKEKRLANSLSIEEVKSNIRIREEFLIAIEEGNLEPFASEAYYYGFLKQYLQFLQIDEVAIECKTNIDPKIAVIAPLSDSLSPNLFVLIISFIIIALIYLNGINFFDLYTVDPISLEVENHITKMVQDIPQDISQNTTN